MSASLPGIEIDGVRVWPAKAGDALWFWLPLRVRVQRGPDGAAQLNLIEAGDIGFLSVSLNLAVSDEQRARLSARIAQQMTELDSAKIEPRPATYQVERVRATLISVDPPQLLGEARASGVGDNGASLSLSLSGERITAIKSALNGKKGILEFAYDLRVSRSRSASASLSGTLTPASGLVSADTAAIDVAIESALAQGGLTLVEAHDADTPATLTGEVAQQVRLRAREHLLSLWQSDAAGPTAIDVSAESVADEIFAVTVASDAADCIQTH